MCREEVVNCLPHFLGVGAAARDFQKVFRPEATRVFQSTSDIGLAVVVKVYDPTENGVVTQVADVLLQSFSHKVKARN